MAAVGRADLGSLQGFWAVCRRQAAGGRRQRFGQFAGGRRQRFGQFAGGRRQRFGQFAGAVCRRKPPWRF